MIWLESLIILACIMIGARKNGVAMGFAGGVGLCLLVFSFRITTEFASGQCAAHYHGCFRYGGYVAVCRRS